jgi:alcohol dehydrogenase class IV
MSYPAAGMVKAFRPPGYVVTHPLVPHGMSVILTAPAAFRFTYATAPERHLRAAELLGVPVRDLDEASRPEALPRALVALMRDVGIPNGLAAVGYGEGDAAALVEGTLQQPRLLANTPRTVGPRDLDAIVRSSLRNW